MHEAAPYFTYDNPHFGTQNLAFETIDGAQPGIIFLGGFHSDMTGTKAQFLAEWARQNKQSFLRFDYFGHGQSSGDFTQGTLSGWRYEVNALLAAYRTDKQILIGSSFGGFLSVLAALDNPEHIAALILIAPAIDMTERLMWAQFDDTQRTELKQNGLTYMRSDYDPQGYPISKTLIEDGRAHCLLTAPIELDIPIHILHGMQDNAVPWQLSVELAERLTGTTTELHFFAQGDHSLSAPENLAALHYHLTSVLGRI